MDDFCGDVDQAQMSTKRVATAGSSASRGSDVWITNPGEETMPEALNPWAPSYVKMQLGQLQYQIEEEGNFILV